ncbi:hypothetical protein QBC34DRAFT_58748 [Podospora aff. communis PSN243]|uniref:NACHT domain-containing protein n=1 Tax=Podospora aff. communis PSN243 TaxID=3040156 RepID=A0AAV9GSA8_9PEZI|nr:hypothetical protein QBC34DRAFT_58748 [Podospora aff. communis PSN243]
MDPLTAISLASSILTFIEFGAKVISGAADVYGSPSGLTADGQSTQAVVSEMQKFAVNLRPPAEDYKLTPEERALCRLAAACDGICGEIIELIEKCRPTSPMSKSAALLAGLRSRWYEGERRRLEERLGNCRAQLVLQLNYLTSSDIRHRLDIMISSAEKDRNQLLRLSTRLHDLDKKVAVSSLSSDAQAQIISLLGPSSDAIAHQHVLNMLGYSEMRDRYDTVHDAHSGTYEWIFADSSTSDEDLGLETPPCTHFKAFVNAKADARRCLIDWLTSGNGIFHISGKLGSGKSTLMKYICEHPSTKEMLKSWAGRPQLVFASFFFWRPGSALQRSQTGLILSILHDVLDSCRELIPYILPEMWQEARTSSLPQFKRDFRVLQKEVKSGFARLISDPHIHKDYAFCFFIDGLDEYEESFQDDTKFLVDQLCAWTAASRTGVKLCVSSREYNVFMNAFSASSRIQLHHLTILDMTRYVSDRLGHLSTVEDKISITKAVVDNAHGIFLWVVLVTKRMRERIEDGCDVSDLYREIDALPHDLDELFTHLLESLPQSDKKMAYQVFLMLLFRKEKHERIRTGLGLHSLSFLEDYNRDPQFALKERSCAELTRTEIKARKTLTEKRVRGYCKGFVDVGHRWVTFIHRSVPEFLSTYARRSQMASFLGGFDPLDAISQLRLAEALAIPESCIFSLSDILPFLLPLRIMDGRDAIPYAFPEAMSRAVLRHLSMGETTFEADADYGPYTAVAFETGEYGGAIFNTAYCRTPGAIQKAGAGNPQLPIYSATFMGDLGYVKWKLSQDANDNTQIRLDFLLYCLLPSYRTRWEDEECVGFLDFLIRQGLTPQTLSDASYLRIFTFDESNPDLECAVTMTVWQHLLLNCYGYAGVYGLQFRLTELAYALEEFLEHGADPYFQITIDWDGEDVSQVAGLDYREWIMDDDSGLYEESRESIHAISKAVGSSLCLKLVLGKEKREITVKFEDDGRGGILVPYKVEAECLLDYLDLYKARFSNWNRIVELVERNMKLFGGTDEEETADVGSGVESESRDTEKREDDAVKSEEMRSHTAVRLSRLMNKASLSALVLVIGIFIAIMFQLPPKKAPVT